MDGTEPQASQTAPQTTPARPAAPAAKPPPDAHAEIIDGKYHTLGKKTLWIFVIERIQLSIVLLFVAMAMIAIQSDPAVEKFIGPKFTPLIGDVTLGAIGLFVAVFAISYLIAWLTYVNYKFMLGEEALKITRGILSKENVAIPYRQIQDADIERSLYYRMFGLSRLVILTAGHEDEKDDSDEAEGILPAMDRDLAEWMQQELLRRTEIQRVVEVSPSQAQ